MIPTPIVTGANVLRSRATVSAAQLYALNTSVVEMAPGVPGKILVVFTVFLRYFYGGVPFQFLNTAEASLEYGTSGVNAFEGGDIGVAGIVNGATTSGAQLTSNNETQIIPVDATSIGQPLNLYAFNQGFLVGPIKSIAVSPGDPGAGYAPGDTGQIFQGPNETATYVVDTVDGGGGVLTLHIGAAGSKYFNAVAADTGILTGGGDGNLKVDITVAADTTGNGSLQIDVFYQPL